MFGIVNFNMQEHKGWCHTELSANEQTRMEKTFSVQILYAIEKD